MKRDIAGITNSLIGSVLALIAALHAHELPLLATAAIGLSGAILIFRECWLYGGKKKWSYTQV